mgnify:CR=1 FL=1
MIQLPPGFDIALLFDDFVSLSLPFITVAVLFASYKVIMKVIRG